MKTARNTLIVLSLLLLAAIPAAGRKKMLGEGEGVFRPVDTGKLRTYEFTQTLSESERAYLGLEGDGSFTLLDVDADLVVVEFLNVYCYACNMQAPIMNRVHETVESREDMKERVRFFGIAVGNGPEETERFRDQFDIPYAIVADPDFFTLDTIGNPGGTPFTLLLPVDGSGDGPARAHLGVMVNADAFVAEIGDALGAGGEAAEREAYALKKWRNLSPDMNDEEIRKRIRSSAADAGLEVTSMEPVVVTDEKNIFRLTLEGGDTVWAKFAGRAKVCNVCHDIFFILLVDRSGQVLNFTPITVTKYENELISEEEAAFLRGRVTGRSVREPVVFDAEVDAISQATMSSELIFDTMRRLGANLPVQD